MGPQGLPGSLPGLALTLGLTVACVGGEAGGSSAEESNGADTWKPNPAVTTTVDSTDHVATLEYRVFERVTQSEEPHKTLYRLLVLQPGPRQALIKTMRTALDSIAGSDTTLVAVRAILYTFRPTGPAEGDVVPVVWGERVPPEGWAAAGAGSRQRVQRTYVYYGVPAWSEEGAAPSGTER